MRNVETIEYNDKEYKCIYVGGRVSGYLVEDTIATALMPKYNEDDFSYADAEAQYIDEMCYAFVPSEWFNLSKKEFMKKFNKHYD